jgi:purine-binding chemotaxis protein CheW
MMQRGKTGVAMQKTTQLANRTSTLVSFRLAEHLYALPIEPVVQIVEMVAITPIPNVNRSVEGVVNYHGATIPVINLRRYLGMPETPINLDMHIMIVRVAERTVGLVMDSVLQVMDVLEDQIAPASDILPTEMGEVRILRGVLNTPDAEAILVLDLDHLFSAQQVQALVQVTRKLVPDLDSGNGNDHEEPA